MNCSHAQALISGFIDAELDPEEKRELRQHLFSCPECEVEYQQLLVLKNCLNSLPMEPCDLEPLLGLEERLSDERLLFNSYRSCWFKRMGLVAACLSAFFISTVLLFPSKREDAGGYLAEDSSLTVNPVSFDQNLSADQAVSVYQVSLVQP